MKVRPGPLALLDRREVSVKALRAFAEVMYSGSATAAARQLGVSQSAVSRLIAQLEDSFGCELFYREKGRLIATEDGKRLLAEAELTLSSFERLNNLARDMSGLSSGSIRVVAPPSFSLAVLPDIVALFLERHPGVEFSIDSRSPGTSRSMIAMRYADCGFVKLPCDDGALTTETMMTSGSICVMRADHPLTGESVITPQLIGAQPLILLGAGGKWRSQVDVAFAAANMVPSVAIETHTHGSACAFAARGLGIAILNEALAQPYLHAPLVAREFSPNIIHEYAFAVSAMTPPSRLTDAFAASAREVLSSRFCQTNRN